MNVKTLKTAALCLTALLLAATTAAQAVYQLPKMGPGNRYWCSYSIPGSHSNPGWSWWEVKTSFPGKNLYNTYEHFQVPQPWGEDNQKMSFANPRYVDNGTRWESTTYDGVQCTVTDVLYSQSVLVFQGCNDNSLRLCTLY